MELLISNLLICIPASMHEKHPSKMKPVLMVTYPFTHANSQNIHM